MGRFFLFFVGFNVYALGQLGQVFIGFSLFVKGGRRAVCTLDLSQHIRPAKALNNFSSFLRAGCSARSFLAFVAAVMCRESKWSRPGFPLVQRLKDGDEWCCVSGSLARGLPNACTLRSMQ
jgi:hypothetical protein